MAGVQAAEPVGAPPDGAVGPGDVRVRLALDGEAAAMVAPVSSLLADRGSRLRGVDLSEPSLQDVFISLTGRDLR
jgi:ABC-2 type transport system ATP-binding protein